MACGQDHAVVRSPPGSCRLRRRIGIGINNCVICDQISVINSLAMSIKGPIISIEDDADDQFLISAVVVSESPGSVARQRRQQLDRRSFRH